MKRMNKLNVIGILLLSLCACTQTTTGIWNETTYNENINHFLIDPNNSSLIVIGGEHHYIFSKDSAPLPILKWEGRKLLHADFSSVFEVDEKIVLQVSTPLSALVKAHLKKNYTG